jgi:hypothetical protein
MEHSRRLSPDSGRRSLRRKRQVENDCFMRTRKDKQGLSKGPCNLPAWSWLWGSIPHTPQRWLHSLSPSVKKTAWTPEEDKRLLELYAIYHTKWAQIAREIPGDGHGQAMKAKLLILNITGRTDDACSKRYREALDPSLKKDEWTQEEDCRLTELYQRLGGRWGQIGHELQRSGLGCRNRCRSSFLLLNSLMLNFFADGDCCSERKCIPRLTHLPWQICKLCPMPLVRRSGGHTRLGQSLSPFHLILHISVHSHTGRPRARYRLQHTIGHHTTLTRNTHHPTIIHNSSHPQPWTTPSRRRRPNMNLQYIALPTISSSIICTLMLPYNPCFNSVLLLSALLFQTLSHPNPYPQLMLIIPHIILLMLCPRPSQDPTLHRHPMDATQALLHAK